MTDPITRSDAVLLGLFVFCGCMAIPILNAILERKPMQTRVIDTTELLLNSYYFDGLNADLVLLVSFTELHSLTSAGHRCEGTPEMVRATITHARLLDKYKNRHEASRLEIQQIQRQLDRDADGLARVRRMLSAEAGA